MKMYGYRLLVLLSMITPLTQARDIDLKDPRSDIEADYEFTVVGDGSAGLVVVGLLRDLGIDGKKIAWVGPEFKVGRLANYAEVPANSTLQHFFNFLRACKTFSAMQLPSLADLLHYDARKEYPLAMIIKPLQEITDILVQQVDARKGLLRSLDFKDEVWHVAVDQTVFTSKRVVLATGSHPRSLNYECSVEIPLDAALNKSQLAQIVRPDDTIAVVGGAHSAVLIMKALSELPVARIINFYNKPICYPVDMGGWTLHAEAGLKGVAAEWARNVLEKNPPANLTRFFNSEAARKAWLPLCTKIVYAVGFERNQVPPINGIQQDISYDSSTGVIAPHLFGIGIAFPEHYLDPQGNDVHRIGLNSFMTYAQRVVPEWMHKGDVRHRFIPFESLFTIDLL